MALPLIEEIRFETNKIIGEEPLSIKQRAWIWVQTCNSFLRITQRMATIFFGGRLKLHRGDTRICCCPNFSLNVFTTGKLFVYKIT